ncbi:MAG: T9SS type A sorting domain-containing protein [Chitinophagaceae bacterium]|nr:MAG: T9SS type A sorting domain-containing protein [Chitinophagaceae bacterium]
MKQIILFFISFLLLNSGFSQPVVSARISQTSYSNTDPDGAGPATGSVKIRWEVMATETVQADGFGIGFYYQTANLVPGTPVEITPVGPLATLGWTIINNFGAPNAINIAYGGHTYNSSILIGGSWASTGLNLPITTSWAPILEATFFTKSPTFPQGGQIILVPGTILPQHSVSADGGFTEYQFESPGYPAGISLGGTVPVLFSSFDAKCSNNGTVVSWSTAQESNSDYFEVQRSTDGSTWKTIGKTPAAVNSSRETKYNQVDLEGGNAMYRIKQVDRNGQATYTDVERENCTVRNITTLIYPVPAKEALNVVIKSDRAVRTQLAVFDISGKLVKGVDANIQNGTNNFRIDLNGLKSGDYILRSTDASIELNKQFTVVQ